MISGRNVHYNLLWMHIHSLYVTNFRSNITYSRGRYAATRSLSKSTLVSAAITILYMDVMVGAGCQWYVAKWQLVDNGDTRDSVSLSLWTFPRWLGVVSDLSFFISYMIADGLLVRISIISFIYNLTLTMVYT
jgi:hypothetical protein